MATPQQTITDRTPPNNTDGMGHQISADETVELELPTGEDFETEGLLDYAPVVEDLSGDKPKDVVEREAKLPREPVVAPDARTQTQQQPPDATGAPQERQVPSSQETPPTQVTPPTTQTAPRSETPDFITHVVANRASIVKGLAENHFAPSDAELGLLESDPKTFFGMMRAQTYVDALLAQSQIMKEALPRIIAQQVGQINNESAHEQTFFSKHPDLNKPELQDGLVALANSLKVARPDLNREQFMDTLAVAARSMWGMSAPTTVQQRGNQTVTRQKISGFQPAASKSAGTNRGQQQERSQVHQLFDLLQADEDDG